MFRASGGDNLAAIFGPERAERSFLFTNLKEGRGVGRSSPSSNMKATSPLSVWPEKS